MCLSGVISLIKNSDLDLGILPFCALVAFYQSAVYAKPLPHIIN
jgi:hypothetical protein